MSEKIVAIGLLTQRELGLLGPAFNRVWPVDPTPDFDDLLNAIDEAEKERSARGEPNEEDKAAVPSFEH